MRYLDDIAERRIAAAIQAGELENLAGAGRPIAPEEDLVGVAPELRTGYRLLRNAGFIPEEVRLRREIAEVSTLLAGCVLSYRDKQENQTRLRRLLIRMGEIQAANVSIQSEYFTRVAGHLTNTGKQE